MALKLPSADQVKKAGAVLAASAVLIAGFEGLATHAYKDMIGTGHPETVCYGETVNVHVGDSYTKTQCIDMLTKRLVGYQYGMDACVDPSKIPDASKPAFISFTYNAGISAFCNSSMARDLRAGNLRDRKSVV